MSAQKEQKETRKLAEETAQKWREHPKAEVHGEFAAATVGGEEKANLPEIHAQDGYVLLNTHGEARLDRDQVVTFRKLLEQAFQVVA